MIKVFTAFTEEADFADIALEEINEQIKPDTNLRSNSLGIVHWHPDFLTSDVLKAVADELPFPVLGCASCGVAASGHPLCLCFIFRFCSRLAATGFWSHSKKRRGAYPYSEAAA
ncbi:hypothetical protein FACS189490_02090 [Clostridia bacterium]|nr:hypothetical protein FACS189490_02090 [Clostridia bacterium]